jgi:hypothetical protein
VRFVKQLCIAINKKYNQISSSSLLHVSTVRDKSMKNFRNINNLDDEENVDAGGGVVPDADDELEINARDVHEAGESSGEKMLNKIDDEVEYLGEDEERGELKMSSDEDDDEESVSSEQAVHDESEKGDGGGGEGNMVVNENGASLRTLSKSSISIGKINRARINRVLNISDLIANYSYDTQGAQWAEVTFKVRLNIYINIDCSEL